MRHSCRYRLHQSPNHPRLREPPKSARQRCSGCAHLWQGDRLDLRQQLLPARPIPIPSIRTRHKWAATRASRCPSSSGPSSWCHAANGATAWLQGAPSVRHALSAPNRARIEDRPRPRRRSRAQAGRGARPRRQVAATLTAIDATTYRTVTSALWRRTPSLRSSRCGTSTHKRGWHSHRSGKATRSYL